jgi:hypothetical protein
MPFLVDEAPKRYELEARRSNIFIITLDFFTKIPYKNAKKLRNVTFGHTYPVASKVSNFLEWLFRGEG